MMKKQAFLCVNLAVLLFGLAGLFAKWIQLPAICITFGRVFFSSISLGIFMRIRRQSYPDSGPEEPSSSDLRRHGPGTALVVIP